MTVDQRLPNRKEREEHAPFLSTQQGLNLLIMRYPPLSKRNL